MDLNKEAEELFGKHFNGMHNDDITSNHIIRYAIDLVNSKYVQAEKIKAQIEVLKELSEAESKIIPSLIIILEDLYKQLNEIEIHVP